MRLRIRRLLLLSQLLQVESFRMYTERFKQGIPRKISSKNSECKSLNKIMKVGWKRG